MSEALATLEALAYAPSTQKGKSSRWRWWLYRSRARGLPPLPVDPSSLRLAGALLLHGRYASGVQYLDAIKGQHVRAGYDWSHLHAVVYADSKRALLRGLGPSAQAAELDLEALVEAAEQDKLEDLLPLLGLGRVSTLWWCRALGCCGRSKAARLSWMQFPSPTRLAYRMALPPGICRAPRPT